MSYGTPSIYPRTTVVLPVSPYTTSVRPIPPSMPTVPGSLAVGGYNTGYSHTIVAPAGGYGQAPLSVRLDALRNLYQSTSMSAQQYQELSVQALQQSLGTPLGEKMDALKQIYQGTNMSAERFKDLGVGLIMDAHYAPQEQRLQMLQSLYQGSNMGASEYAQLQMSLLSHP